MPGFVDAAKSLLPQSLGLSANPAESQLVASPFGISEHQAQQLARQIAEEHRRGKARKRGPDLTREKYMVHIDGTGGGQWADIVDGMYVGIPPYMQPGLKLQRNLLRPMTDNMVAYHTAIPYRAVVRSSNDKASRDKARVDELHANHVILHQRLNEMSAAALYTAAAYGHGILHSVWRDDISQDPFDPIYNTNLPEYLQEAMRPGFIDIYLGDPWATAYPEGATRYSVGSLTYDRVLPTELVRQAFAHVKSVERLEGRTDLPSASRFQRTLRRWMPGGAGFATSALTSGQAGEELSALICKEIAPGTASEYPEGALLVVAINGVAEADDRTAGGGSLGQAILLHAAPLPGKRFSAHRFYTGQAFDDVAGAPYVKDLDDLQVQLNQLVTMRVEFLRRFSRPPLVARAGSIEDDTTRTDDDAILYTSAEQMPQFLYPPTQGLSFFNDAIRETLDEMFRIGGWQAASRGESNPGDPAAKVVALARADDTIFGPVNRQFQQSICDLLQTSHALAKQYMTVPTMAKLIGEEWAYLADPWISQEKMSDKLPLFQLVQGFGSTPDAKAQQLMGLVSMTDAGGKPLLEADDFWRLWPDNSLRPPERSSHRVKQMRAQLIAQEIDNIVRKTKEQYQGQFPMQLLGQIHMQLGQRYPLLRTDDPAMHTDVLDQIVQDEYADPAARQLARWRQDMYFDFQNQIAMQGQPQAQQPQQPQQSRPGTPDQRQAAMGGNTPAGTTTSAAMSPQSIGPTVNALTQQARTG